MKAPQENIQEVQNETTQRVQKEASTSGQATIADHRPTMAIQRKLRAAIHGTEKPTSPIQRKNNTGLPDTLKSGIENLSGYAMNDVKVHYNSSKPAQLRAHAYAQGTDIHLGPGQEKHLPHEAWHVVQQKQGRVKPTMQFKGKVAINDDAGLEKEADVMGQKAASITRSEASKNLNYKQLRQNKNSIQCKPYELASHYYEMISKFIAHIKLCKSEPQLQQKVDGQLVSDLVPYSLIVDNQPEPMVEAYRCYITGETPDDKVIKAILKELTPRLNKVYGVDDLNRIMKKNKFNRGWYDPDKNPGGVKFKTNGLAFNFHAYNSSKVGELKNKMLRQIITQEIKLKKPKESDQFAEKRARNRFKDKSYDEWTLSGEALPDIEEVSPDQVFYKIMGPGKNFMNSFSVYYLDQDTYNYIKTSGSFMDLLGLPVLSYEAVYAVYRIKAKVKTDVFKSKIASAKSVGGRRESGQYSKVHPGGLTQTLIVNSNDTSVWEKISTPYEILDPDEQAVESLRKSEYTPPS